MSREEGYNGHVVTLSFFLGAVAGATAVLLLAPQARRESAQRIREFSTDLKERATDYLDSAKEKVTSGVTAAAISSTRSVPSSSPPSRPAKRPTPARRARRLTSSARGIRSQRAAPPSGAALFFRPGGVALGLGQGSRGGLG